MAGCRSLSHWPGNSTPAALKHDLSTGIALAFARLSPAERRALVGTFDRVCNNHYDTDGALSALALVRPEAALPRAEAMLAAAGTGDYGWWRGPAALAVDLTVMQLGRHERSPLAAEIAAEGRRLDALDDDERHGLAYAWLLRHLPAVLDDPMALRSMWEEPFGRVLEDVRRVEAGAGVSVRAFPDEELALVSSDRPITTIGLNLAAGDAHRVLLVRPSAQGFRYLFRHRVESWFEMASRRPLPRAPLEPAVDALNRAEGVRAGAASSGAAPRWFCLSNEAPVAELGFGDPAGREGGIYDDPDVEDDPPSRLLPSRVIDALRASWSAGPAGPRGR